MLKITLFCHFLNHSEERETVSKAHQIGKNETQWSLLQLKLGLLDPESSSLTIKPPHLLFFFCRMTEGGARTAKL